MKHTKEHIEGLLKKPSATEEELNETDEDGFTPLTFAANYPNSAIAINLVTRLLAKNLVTPDLRDAHNQTALDIAINRSEQSMVRHLTKKINVTEEHIQASTSLKQYTITNELKRKHDELKAPGDEGLFSEKKTTPTVASPQKVQRKEAPKK